MMTRVLWMAVTVLAGVTLAYLSRFWVFDLWGREGLLGQRGLRPQGDLVSVWLRGTGAEPFELLLWACGAFLVLGVLERIYQFFSRRS